MLTEKQFMKGMGILMNAYPDYECTPGTVDIYRERLRPRLTPQEWEAAVNRHIDTCKWFPKVSELLQAAQELLPSPLEIWNRLIAAAEDGEENPEMDDAIRQAIAVIGGWEEFSRTSYDSLHYRFKEFKAAFLEARAQERQSLKKFTPDIESQRRAPLQIER